MSLLRNAERCLANQQTHKLLNAFVTSPLNGAWLQQHGRAIEEAEKRQSDGKSPV